MKIIAFLIIYLAGGLALYPFSEYARPVAVFLQGLYSSFSITFSVDLGLQLSLCYIYSSLFHLVWYACFSESSKSWMSTIRFKSVVHLALRLLSNLLFSLLGLGLVGMSEQAVPSSDFHQYFKFLVICMLLGTWTRSFKDFLMGVVGYSRREAKCRLPGE